AVRRAYAEIMAIGRKLTVGDDVEGVLIQPMIAGGVETMIGVSDDPLFGPLVAFGLGGIHVEVLGDVQFRVAPLTDRDATELLPRPPGAAAARGLPGPPAGRSRGAARDAAPRVAAGGRSAGDRRSGSQPGDRAAAGARLPDRRRPHSRSRRKSGNPNARPRK